VLTRTKKNTTLKAQKR